MAGVVFAHMPLRLQAGHAAQQPRRLAARLGSLSCQTSHQLCHMAAGRVDWCCKVDRGSSRAGVLLDVAHAVLTVPACVMHKLEDQPTDYTSGMGCFLAA